MINTTWYKCTGNSWLLVTFNNDGSVEQIQDAFIAAAAKAEAKFPDLTIIVDEEGRRRIDTIKITVSIANKANHQKDIAQMYAALIPIANIGWHKINMAIKKRWPSESSLIRVKTMAWKIHGEVTQ